MTEKLLPDVLKDLTCSLDGLRVEVEGWRKHTGSTGYFLLVAVEDLIKRVDELKAALK